MKRKFTILTAALMLLSCLAVPLRMWGQTTITFTSAGSVTAGNVTVVCEKSNGSNAPAWYDPNIRLYAKNTITITPASGYQITSLEYSFYKQGSKEYASASMTSSDGTYTDATSTSSTEEAVAVWSGTTSNAVVIKLGDSGQRSFRQVVVTTISSSGGSDTYTVTYNSNGATLGTVPTDATQYNATNNTVTVLDNINLEKPGNDWSGWCLNAAGTGTVYGPAYTTTYTISENTTFYAKWTAHTHDVTMPDDDEYGSYTASEDTDVPYGTTVTLTYEPATGYEDYVATWSVNGTAINGNSFEMPDEDVTVTVALMQVKIDVINKAFTGYSGSYASWEGTGNSGAVYAGISLGSTTQDYIQITSSTSGNSANCGIISTGSGGKVKKVVVTWNNTTSDGRTLNVYGSNTAYTATSELYNSSTYGTLLGTIVKGTSTTLTIDGNYKFVGFKSNANAMYLTKIEVYWEPSTEPSITASDVNITYDATGGNIAYTINNPVDGATLQATVAPGATISSFALGTVGASPITFTCNANSETTAKTATITLNYVKNNETLATKDVTITQDAAPLIYTTIPAIFEAATSTETTVTITFNNWVISAVNGSNAFLTDNAGHGLIIYTSNHGFAVNDKLSGTVSTSLKLYKGSAELVGLKASDFTTVTNDGTVTPQNIAINTLTGVNTGALLSYTDLTYDGTNLVDGNNNSIKPYSTLYSYTFASGKTYDVTGVYWKYDDTKELMPRSADDVVLKADLSNTDFSGLTTFSYVATVGGPSAAQHFEIYCEDLGTNNLTVTASSDYEVCLTENGTYTSSVEMTPSSGDVMADLYVRLKAGFTTAGEHNGTLTFSATNLTAVVVNLVGEVTATQNYTITLNQTTGATIESDYAIAAAGTTVTLSYSGLDDCYTFGGWTVLNGSAETVTVTNNQFIMPASDVEVAGIFTQKIFTMSYSVNGVVYDVLEETVTCGGNAPLHSASVLDGLISLPSGYSLNGWSTAASSTTTVSSFTPTENATLYAVLSPSGSTSSYELVTSASQITAGKYLFAALRSTELPDPIEYSIATGSISSGDIMVTTNKYTPTNNAFATIPTGGVEFELTGNNTDGFVISYNSTSLGYTANQSRKLAFGEYDSYLWKFYDEEEGLSTGAIYMQNYRNYVYYTVSENSTQEGAIRGYSGKTVYRGFYLFKKIEAVSYTRIEEISSAETLPSIEPTYSITVKNGGVLTLTGANNGDASNLIIEDGGQLITSNAVAATLQKDIEAYSGATGVGNTDGWYFIASPVNGFLTSTIDTDATSDLYRYNEPTCQWFNAQGTNNSFTTLTRGQGYLYANSTGNDLSFAGEMPATNSTITMNLSYAYDGTNGNLKGLNLVGNPFTCNLTSDNVEINNTALTSYFIVENGTEITSMNIASNPIKPGRGFMVQATDENQQLVFNPTAKQGESKTKPSFISIEAGNDTFMDRAYVQIGNGNTLRKMTINDKVSHVYVMDQGKDYAAATITELQGEMPVNFEVAANGEYTITVSMENVEMDYLHLIDNLTGIDTDLLQTPSYTFEASTTDYPSRFRLVFNANDENGATDSETFAYFNGSEWVISNNGNATLQVIDAMGRILRSENLNGNATFNTSSLGTGVYVMRLVNGNDVKVQKIVVR